MGQGSTKGITIGRFAGAPIILRWSWLPLMLLLVVGYGLNLASWQSLSLGQAFLASGILALSLAGGVFLHELAHAAVASSRRAQVRSISLSIWGGQTQVRKMSPSTALLVALSGPLVNLLLAALFYGLWLINPSVHLLGFFLAAQVNGAVALFNLLPALPLDGGLALEAFLYRLTGGRTLAKRLTAYSGLLLLALLLSFLFMTGLWQNTSFLILGLALILYLGLGARRALREAQLESSSQHPLQMGRLMIPLQFAPAQETLGQALAGWDGHSALLLEPQVAGGPQLVLTPDLLRLADQSLHPLPLTALAQEVNGPSLALSSSPGQLIDQLAGFAYYQQLDRGQEAELWLVEDQGRALGLVERQRAWQLLGLFSETIEEETNNEREINPYGTGNR